jgi:5-oxoprolinase (ATP-hydrolysing)
VKEKQKVYKEKLRKLNDDLLDCQFDELIKVNLSNCEGDRNQVPSIIHEKFLEIKYEGSDYSLMIKGESYGEYKKEFERQYFTEFGFISEERELLVEAIRVRSVFLNGKGD